MKKLNLTNIKANVKGNRKKLVKRAIVAAAALSVLGSSAVIYADRREDQIDQQIYEKIREEAKADGITLISEDDAKKIAFGDAKVQESDVKYLEIALDDELKGDDYYEQKYDLYEDAEDRAEAQYERDYDDRDDRDDYYDRDDRDDYYDRDDRDDYYDDRDDRDDYYDRDDRDDRDDYYDDRDDRHDSSSGRDSSSSGSDTANSRNDSTGNSADSHSSRPRYIYEVDFTYDGVEYTYDIDAESKEILHLESESQWD